VDDVQKLRQNYDDRSALRTAAGCTGSRILVDTEDPNSVLVELAFPSVEAARKYATGTGGLIGSGTLTAMTKVSAEYFDDVSSANVSPRLSKPS
jgi:hypothetical protein